jgi:acetyl esterase/lipase
MVIVAAILAMSMTAGEPLSGFTRETGIVYAEPGGKALRGDLYLPDAPLAEGEKRPAIVIIHGGAWIAGRRAQLAYYARNFARRGYVAFAIEYRRMPRHPFPAPLHDCKAAVRWLHIHADEYDIDATRIAALGGSAGAHLAAFLAVTDPGDGFEGTDNLGHPSTIRAAVSIYGALDLTQFGERKRQTGGRVRDGYLKAFAGRPGSKTADALAWASPISYIDRHAAPVLLIHGTRDMLVDHSQSERFQERMEKAGVDAPLILVPGRNHGFDFLFWRQRADLLE